MEIVYNARLVNILQLEALLNVNNVVQLRGQIQAQDHVQHARDVQIVSEQLDFVIHVMLDMDIQVTEHAHHVGQ